jgi:hypothetical protein
MLAFERGDGGVVASLCDAQVETEEEGREGEVWKLMGGGALVRSQSFRFDFLLNAWCVSGWYLGK